MDRAREHVHLDRQKIDDPQIGDFNGWLIKPQTFVTGSIAWDFGLRFTQLAAPQDADNACIRLRAGDTIGQRSRWASWSRIGGAADWLDGDADGDCFVAAADLAELIHLIADPTLQSSGEPDCDQNLAIGPSDIDCTLAELL